MKIISIGDGIKTFKSKFAVVVISPWKILSQHAQDGIDELRDELLDDVIQKSLLKRRIIPKRVLMRKLISLHRRPAG